MLVADMNLQWVHVRTCTFYWTRAHQPILYWWIRPFDLNLIEPGMVKCSYEWTIDEKTFSTYRLVSKKCKPAKMLRSALEIVHQLRVY